MFSQTSTFKVLRALFLSPEAVSLRELAYRTDLLVRSVQLVIDKALSDDLVIVEDQGYRKFYAINPEHREFAALNAYFSILNLEELQASKELNANAGMILRRTSELLDAARMLRAGA